MDWAPHALARPEGETGQGMTRPRASDSGTGRAARSMSSRQTLAGDVIVTAFDTTSRIQMDELAILQAWEFGFACRVFDH